MPPGIGYGNQPFLGRRQHSTPDWQQNVNVGRAPGPSGLTRILQQPGLSDALIAAGTSLLSQSDQPGNLAGALGRSIPVGVQAFRQGQQRSALDQAMEGAPPEMQNLLRALPQGQQAPALFSMMQGQQEEEVEFRDLADGRIGVFDKNSGELLRIQGPAEEQDPTGTLQNFGQWLQMSPEEREQFGEFMETQRSPGTTVNVGEQSPREKVLMGLDEAELEDARSAAASARSTIDTLDQMENLLDEGVETGALEEMVMPFREAAAGFGINVEGLSQQQVFRALQNELTLGVTQSMSGQLSNKELDFAGQVVPSLSNTVEGNRRLIQIARRIAERKQDVATAKRRYFRENGTLEGFDETVLPEIVDGNLFEGISDTPPEGDGGQQVRADDRIQELKAQGLSADEIIEIGREEGWVR